MNCLFDLIGCGDQFVCFDMDPATKMVKLTFNLSGSKCHCFIISSCYWTFVWFYLCLSVWVVWNEFCVATVSLTFDLWALNHIDKNMRPIWSLTFDLLSPKSKSVHVMWVWVNVWAGKSLKASQSENLFCEATVTFWPLTSRVKWVHPWVRVN